MAVSCCPARSGSTGGVDTVLLPLAGLEEEDPCEEDAGIEDGSVLEALEEAAALDELAGGFGFCVGFDAVDPCSLDGALEVEVEGRLDGDAGCCCSSFWGDSG